MKIADLLDAHQFGRFMEMYSELLDGELVAANRVGIIVTALEFLQHPLS